MYKDAALQLYHLSYSILVVWKKARLENPWREERGS